MGYLILDIRYWGLGDWVVSIRFAKKKRIETNVGNTRCWLLAVRCWQLSVISYQLSVSSLEIRFEKILGIGDQGLGDWDSFREKKTNRNECGKHKRLAVSC